MWDLWHEHGTTLIEMLIGLVVLIVLIALMDGSGRRHGATPPDDSSKS